MSADIDEMIERLKSKKGVMGVLVIDWEGRAIKSTFDQVQLCYLGAVEL